MPASSWRPMPLLRVREPFDHPDWLFELKHDGFRAFAIVEGHRCRLVSRRGHRFKQWAVVEEEIAHQARVSRSAVLDGELVCLRPDGGSDFYSLLYRRDWPVFYAFDLLDLDGRDLRGLTLRARKRELRRIMPKGDPRSRLRFLDHVAGRGRDLYAAACERDTEGIVAKWAGGPYHVDGTTTSWVKVKNPSYTQMVGRHEAFATRGDGRPRTKAPPYRLDPSAARAW